MRPWPTHTQDIIVAALITAAQNLAKLMEDRDDEIAFLRQRLQSPDPWRKMVQGHFGEQSDIAECDKAIQDNQAESRMALQNLFAAQQQLIYWWERERSCPCGARAESPDTHPHVPGCPTEEAIKRGGPEL